MQGYRAADPDDNRGASGLSRHSEADMSRSPQDAVP
jgi:hypothetical protein